MGSLPGHSEAPALGVMQDRVRLLCVVFDKYVEAQVSPLAHSMTPPLAHTMALPLAHSMTLRLTPGAGEPRCAAVLR